MPVRRLSLRDVDTQAWARLLAASPHATPFHTLAWARALAAQPEFSITVRVIEDEDGYFAGHLVAERCAAVRQLLALPFGTYGHPLVASSRAPSAHAREDRASRAVPALIADLLSTFGRVAALELVDFACVGGVPPEARSVPVRTRILPLDRGYPALAAARFEPTVRQKIRQAERAGLRVRHAHDEASVATFLRLAEGAYARHASAPPPPALYEATVREMAPTGEALLSVAEVADGRVAGAALHLAGGAHVLNWLTAIDPEHARTRPANLLVNDAICWSLARGARVYNFGATPEGAPGVDAFKKAWGAEEHTYYTHTIQTPLYRLARHAARYLRAR
jgi:CelD/BcsL family acetyltransferase involved in cellulose biosynthesis